LKFIEKVWDTYIEELVLPCSRAIAAEFGETIGWIHFAGAIAGVPVAIICGAVLILQAFGVLPAMF
jgi:hypothetical protein